MAENPYLARIDGADFRIELEPRLHAASLRYFERDGAFPRLVQRVTGLAVPDELRTAHSAPATAGVTILAWRSPSETTLITSDDDLPDSLQAAAAAIHDGCIVDLRSGTLVFRARGQQVATVVARTAGHGAMPAIGDSRRARLAEVPVLLVKVQDDETLILVERIYAPHVMSVLRVSAADLGAPLFN